MRFLVIGCGSIGKRHMRNLKTIGCNDILAFDVKKERLEEVREYGVTTFDNLDEAFAKGPDAVLVCSPPVFHVQNALKALQKGCHIFIEKPLSNTLEGVDELISIAKEKQLVTMVGFNLRFDRGLQIVKKLLDDNAVGNIITAISIVGQYLPDQHPWEDYRYGYAANESLGGGVILDGMHEIDVLSWFLGDPKQVCCFGGKLSSLDINTEDTAAYLLKYCSNAVGIIEMDYVKRVYERTCELIGEQGTIRWDFKDRTVKYFSAKTKEWTNFQYAEGYDTNNMYVEELKCFFNCLNGAETPPVSAEAGKKLLKIALASKESMATKKVIIL
jgi:predicted dehydrogenase